MYVYGSTEGKYEEQYSKLLTLVYEDKGYRASSDGEMLDAINGLFTEWYRNGNMNWGWGGQDVFLDDIQCLWDNFFPSEDDDADQSSRNDDDALLDDEDDEDAVRLLKIKEDLAFIELLGLTMMVPPTTNQGHRILETASPNDEYMDAPFRRIQNAVVEQCHRGSTGPWGATEETKIKIAEVFKSMPELD